MEIATGMKAFEHPFAGSMARATAIDGSRGAYRTAVGDFTVPIHYRGVRTFLVTMPAKLASLQLLMPADVRARRLFDDYGALVVQFVDLPNTSIGPYTECTVAVIAEDSYRWPRPAVDLAWEPPPCYALWLAVSSKLAQHSGQAIWGYPKTLAETTFEVEAGRFRGQVHMNERIIIECDAQLPTDEEHANIHMRSLTHLRGELCRTSIDGACVLAASEPGNCQLTFHQGSRISEALKTLALAAEPVSTVYVHKYDYLLGYPLGGET